MPLAADREQWASMTRRSVLVLGSTGSIGVQTLDVVAANPDRFEVAGVAAGGADPAALAAQAIASGARAIAVSRSTAAEDVQLALYAEAKRRGYERGGFPMPRILAGPGLFESFAVALLPLGRLRRGCYHRDRHGSGRKKVNHLQTPSS